MSSVMPIHWKPDVRIPFIPEENGLISGLFIYAIHTVDKLNILIAGLFLYPVSSVLK